MVNVLPAESVARVFLWSKEEAMANTRIITEILRLERTGGSPENLVPKVKSSLVVLMRKFSVKALSSHQDQSRDIACVLPKARQLQHDHNFMPLRKRVVVLPVGSGTEAHMATMRYGPRDLRGLCFKIGGGGDGNTLKARMRTRIMLSDTYIALCQ